MFRVSLAAGARAGLTGIARLDGVGNRLGERIAFEAVGGKVLEPVDADRRQPGRVNEADHTNALSEHKQNIDHCGLPEGGE